VEWEGLLDGNNGLSTATTENAPRTTPQPSLPLQATPRKANRGAAGTFEQLVIATWMTAGNPTGQGQWVDNDEQQNNTDNREMVPHYHCPNSLTSCAREVFRSLLPHSKCQVGRAFFLVVMYIML
jgi:hypothetical protein